MDLGLGGARVLVTGGASNIGRGIVHGFAAEHTRVLICDIDGEQAAKVGAEATNRGAAEVAVCEVDLAQEGGGTSAVQQVLDTWGGIDVLVNNAGWNEPGFIAKDTSRAKWQKTFEVNLFSAIECTQAVIPPMREAGAGAIVYISSDAAQGEIRQGVYGASKAGMIALARTVAREHGRHGIRSNVVCPGLVLPESDAAVGASSLWSVGTDNVFDQRQIDYMLGQIPLKRLTTADDIANAVTWISSERVARQVTGQVISVSGGFSMP
jgi:2-hydroxycyclohexanecarboxyl-CoA dehydrogenase